MTWYQKAWRRGVLDMHITEDNPRFMTQFDPQRFVDLMLEARLQSVVLYAHSHVGSCFYPSLIAPVHSGPDGRDIFGETVALCHENDIAVVGYMSLIYDTLAWRAHPDWRITHSDYQGHSNPGRYGVCCPNSPYRDYAASLAGELAAGYPLEGIRFDMTFWPGICYCPHCRQRFMQEVGGELPTVIDWFDPRWARFARKREEWLVEFAALCTDAVRAVDPAISVEHQSSTFAHPWRFGVTTPLAAQTDFLQGDFYGDILQGSFVRKLFHNLSPNRPGGFETSVSATLSNYTALKDEALLRCKAYAALADGCAFIFIDSVDPVGTINPLAYQRMGRIFEETQACEPWLGGELQQDVAIYVSTESKGDFADNGKSVGEAADLHSRAPHVEAALGACQALIEHNIPWGVITRNDLDRLDRHAMIVLPNVLMMDAQECAAFREYVRGGGKLYASRYSSLVTSDGHYLEDFMLADVFGAQYAGETVESFTYIAPAPGHEPLFGEGYSRSHPPGLDDRQIRIVARPEAQVPGELVLPWTDPADPWRFASIHNNPPGRFTGQAAILHNYYGAGQAIYVAGDIESSENCHDLFINLLLRMQPAWSFASDAPRAVEISLFHQPDESRWLINLINFQQALPNIPAREIQVRLRVPQRPLRLLQQPAGRELPFESHGDGVSFTLPELETFAMLTLEYA
ncbi:MAG: beta-galactosidase trimerization domain-containing protein [Anaerolineae bacterium]|nr:beta-galactosidase trimerization domain-containing protein [Anaerolineae bacterium]